MFIFKSLTFQTYRIFSIRNFTKKEIYDSINNYAIESDMYSLDKSFYRAATLNNCTNKYIFLKQNQKLPVEYRQLILCKQHQFLRVIWHGYHFFKNKIYFFDEFYGTLIIRNGNGKNGIQ